MSLPAGATEQTPNYLSKVGNLNSNFVDAYSLNLKPQVFNNIYNQSGAGFGMLQFLGLAGRTINIPRQTVKVFEYGREREPIILSTVIPYSGHTAGATITGLELDSTMYDSETDNAPIREGMSLYIPAKYTNQTDASEWRINITTSTAGALVFSITPYKSTVTLSADVAIGTELMAGATKFASGTGQPTGFQRGLLERSYYPTLLKESLGIEGGQGALDRYTDNMKEIGYRIRNYKGGYTEGTSYISKEMLVAQWRLMDQFNTAFLIGDRNSSAISETGNWGGSNPILSGDGYWNLLTSLGMSKSYNTTWEIWDFDVTDILFTNQGVLSDKVYFGVSRELMRKIENSGYDFLAEYSDTDFVTDMNKVGRQVKVFQKSGREYYCFVIDSFDNPDTFGIDDMGFKGSGFLIPDEMSTFRTAMTGGDKVTIPNLTMGNINRNGENIAMMMGFVSGVNGYGKPFQSQYDGMDFYLAAERMLISGTLNHQIKVTKA